MRNTILPFAFVVLASLFVLFLVGCTTVDTIDIIDVSSNPDAYLGKEITLRGTIVKQTNVLSSDPDSRSETYLKDFQDFQVKLRCVQENAFVHNEKRILTGTMIFDNRTQEYYFRCSSGAAKASQTPANP